MISIGKRPCELPPWPFPIPDCCTVIFNEENHLVNIRAVVVHNGEEHWKDYIVVDSLNSTCYSGHIIELEEWFMALMNSLHGEGWWFR